MIWLHRDKITQELNGDATVAFEDPHAAAAAVEWFNNTEMNGHVISVSVTEGVQCLNLVAMSPTTGNRTIYGVPEHGADSRYAGEAGGYYGVEFGGNFEGAGGPIDLEEGRRRGRVDGKPWQQEGDWPCPNSRSVSSLVVGFGYFSWPTYLCAMGSRFQLISCQIFRRGLFLIRVGCCCVYSVDASGMGSLKLEEPISR